MIKNGAWVFKTLFFMAISGTFLLMGVVGLLVWFFSRDLPKIITVEDYRPLVVTRVVGGSGKDDVTMGEFYKERRFLVPFDKMPEVVVRAFTSAEDDQFFQHSGINVASMLRAAIANFRAGHVVQGGSTITQQVAKSLVLTSERSFVRKMKEVIVASRIEHNLTKQQILYLYLNQIYLGHGAYGIQAASKTYFRKDVGALTLGEAALLAGLPQAPGKYSPLLNPKKAKERQLYVLRRMYENKFITQAQMAEAGATSLRVYHDENINNTYSAYLIEHIRRYLVEKYGEKSVYEDGLTVVLPTTPELSLSAGKKLREGLEAVDKRIGFRGPIEHLKSQEEIEAKLRELRLALIEAKAGFQVLLPDGRMDAIEALKALGIKSDRELIEQGKLYKAVVTGTNDKFKFATVMVGAVLAEVPWDKMSWARPIKDEKAGVVHPIPNVPSKVLTKGDVVWVKVVGSSEKGVVASLEQLPEVQGAIFSLDTQTGYVLAMEGGYDFERSEFNRAIQAQRQPGSSFKPIIYSAALEKGYTPATIIVDSPIVYSDADTKWKPANFEEKFYGDTSFRQALIKSRNVPTIKIVQSLQASKMIEYARRIGMTGQFPPDLSISLGSGAISLVEMTKTYALFPRLGRKISPIFIVKVLDRDGKVLEESVPRPLASVLPSSSPAMTQASPLPLASAVPVLGHTPTLPDIDNFPTAQDPDQVMDPRVASVMTHLMKEVVNYGTGHQAKNLNRSAAGKTGTTNDYIDAWFMGFTPSVVTGVWVGYDNLRSLGHNETGARAALPIWLEFMKDAVKGYPDQDFTIPPGVVLVSIDPNSGKLAAPNSSSAIREAFIEGTEPKEVSEGEGVTRDTGSEVFKEELE